MKQRLAALCSALLLLLLPGTVSAQWQVTSGQPLADACEAFGRINQDLLVTLDASSIVELRNATFRQATNSEAAGGKAYSNGTLTIQGSGFKTSNSSSSTVGNNATNGSSSGGGGAAVDPLGTVLDASMRKGLLPPMQNSRLVTRDLTLINSCTAVTQLGGRGSPVSLTSLTAQLLVPVVIYQSWTSYNMISYAPAPHLLNALYLGLTERIVWPVVIKSLPAALAFFPPTQALVRRTSRHEVVMNRFNLPGGKGFNYTVRTTNKPDDALLAFLRREGLLLAETFCNNGSLVPAALADRTIDPVLGPLWMTDTFQEAVEALVNATALAPAQVAAKWPIPAVLLHAPSLNLTEAAVPVAGGSFQLAAPLQLWGPFNDDPTALQPVPVLDLTSRGASPLFNATAAGQLFVTRLVLQATDLKLSSLIVEGSSNTAGTNASTNATRTGYMLELHNVTLVVPVLDYLALLTLATDAVNSNTSNIDTATSANAGITTSVCNVKDCVDQATLQRAAQLQPNVTVLQFTSATWDNISLAAFTGWGVHAINLLIQPQTPVPASVTQHCSNLLLKQSTAPPAASNTTDNGAGDSSPPVGLIAGCTVGGAALLVAVVAAAVALSKRRRRRAWSSGDGFRRESLTDTFPGHNGALAGSATHTCQGLPPTKTPPPPQQHPDGQPVGGHAPHARVSTTSAGTNTATAAAAEAVGHSSSLGTSFPSSALQLGGAPASLLALLHEREAELLTLTPSRLVMFQTQSEASEHEAQDRGGRQAQSGPHHRVAVLGGSSATTTPSAAALSPSGAPRATGQPDPLDPPLGTMPPGATGPLPPQQAPAPGDLQRAHQQVLGSLLASATASLSGGTTGGGGGDARGATTGAGRGKVAGGGLGAASTTEQQQQQQQQREVEVPGGVDPMKRVRDMAARLQGGAAGAADTVVIKEVLAQGGIGVVYLGTWRELPVAVKTMVFEAWEGRGSSRTTAQDGHGGGGGGGVAGSDKAKDQDQGESKEEERHRLRYVRAIMETAISASLGHPNVVATYRYDIKRIDVRSEQGKEGDEEEGSVDATTAVGGLQIQGSSVGVDVEAAVRPTAAASPGMQAYKVYLVQELCTCHLRMVLEKGTLHPGHGTLPTSALPIITLLFHVAKGLEYLHGLGIIHGDLTPTNILLKLDLSQPFSVVAKLADFGLSQRLDGEATHVSDFCSGTPFYVAPEVVHERRTSPASDVYSFGIIMWQAWTRQAPYVPAADGVQLDRNPSFGSFAEGDRPPAVYEELMRRCLSGPPSGRPPSTEVCLVLQALWVQLQAAPLAGRHLAA